MPVITQTSNAKSVWDGTVPADANPDVTGFVLHCSQNTDVISSYRRVSAYANPGVGTVPLGPLTYAQLFLNTPNRKFFLRATKVVLGREEDLAAAPPLSVTPSIVKGWSFEQLVEQQVRPIMPVGFDPVTKLFFPVKVVDDGSGNFRLDTNTSATISGSDIQIGAVEIKDHTTDDRARIKLIAGEAGEFAIATYDKFAMTSSASSTSGVDMNVDSGVAQRHKGTAIWVRSAGSTSITLEIGVRNAGTDYPLVLRTAFTGPTAALTDLDMDAASKIYVKTTGAAGTDDFEVLFINKLYQ